MFVHFSCINTEGFKTPAKGQPMEFDVKRGEKGACKKVCV